MDPRQIEAFRAVMSAGSTVRAAALLRLSQPAVSKAVAALERRVGFSLFRREKGRLLPTAEARLFLRDVERAFVGLAALEGAAARIRDFGSGELRVATRNALSATLVPEALGRFHRRHPRVAVTLQTRLSSEARELVASGQFDLALVADEVETSGLEVALLADHRALLALPPGHPLAARDPVRVDDLEGQDFVALSPEDRARQALERAQAAAGVAPRIVLETPFSLTVCALVAAGLGCGLVHPSAASLFAGRGLVLRRFEPRIDIRTLILTPPGQPPSRLAADFIAALREELARERGHG